MFKIYDILIVSTDIYIQESIFKSYPQEVDFHANKHFRPGLSARPQGRPLP